MFIGYTPEQEALRAEVHAYMDTLMTDDLRNELRDEAREGGGPEYHKAMQKLGRDGWLGISWPKEYGGRGMSMMDEYIFLNEVHYAAFPIPLLTLNTVGPTLMKFGSEEQRKFYLPRILEGKLHFSIGYTEPSSGTDLASLKTRAVLEGEEYVINGQKMWTSLAGHADYLWLAVRTDPEAKKHKGISIIIVPMDTKGVSLTPIRNLGRSGVSAIYLEDVRVPVGNLVGEENGGWSLITSQLNHERIALMGSGLIARMTELTRRWAAQTPYKDGVLIDLPWVRMTLAQVEARVQAFQLMNWRQAWEINEDTLNPADASAIKVFGSEFFVSGYRMLMEVVGMAGTLKEGSAGDVLKGRLELCYRVTLLLTFGGGTNEIQRDIIGWAGLGLPFSRG